MRDTLSRDGIDLTGSSSTLRAPAAARTSCTGTVVARARSSRRLIEPRPSWKPGSRTPGAQSARALLDRDLGATAAAIRPRARHVRVRSFALQAEDSADDGYGQDFVDAADAILFSAANQADPAPLVETGSAAASGPRSARLPTGARLSSAVAAMAWPPVVLVSSAAPVGRPPSRLSRARGIGVPSTGAPLSTRPRAQHPDRAAMLRPRSEVAFGEPAEATLDVGLAHESGGGHGAARRQGRGSASWSRASLQTSRST